VSSFSAASEAAIEIRDLRFSYRFDVDILRIPALKILSGERVFLFGPSGSGKTTLLGLLAGVLETHQGALRVLGQELTRMSRADRDAFRGAHIGYIFQLFNLIPYLSVLENIVLPCRMSRQRRARLGSVVLEQAAAELAAQLNLGDLLAENVLELSVGQQQRVAAARALLGSPELIIADEPTSSLDADHREQFIEVLFALAKPARATVVFVSHDRRLEPLFDRSIALSDINQAQSSA
jgi:putative ABC transport system ATP-binding protein